MHCWWLHALTLSQALAELSCSDSNKSIMGSVRLMQLLTQSLRLFVEDKPQLQLDTGANAEGGGGDIPSARYAVSALAQLSFLHKRDASLLTLMPPDLQLPPLLEASKDVGDDARLQARSLTKRLTRKAVDNSVPRGCVSCVFCLPPLVLSSHPL
jgi:hypothetical protein